MDIEFTQHGWDDFTFWLEHDVDIAIKIKDLLKSIKQNPFKGLGKPEPLRHDLKG
ncbi:MAG: type II toxin-antitoxin system YoeB family toxin, partial [Bacteroidota bacterium]